ncbi:hypothetical protein [Parapedobacter koreensis]|uniref:Spore coat polysaccharide biosynthesis protein SpsG, predicted glycosyltransferase n=1 Tax=Parapedobacter koreensis TaxID=332977 RepID=A0A1H7T643_9SPHI|nr:hypothetical protein [Parapedobacter koreensis]SEL80321.1 Spore coat polysaccharide biosynthesis protein SpsG, predicted glycosyltransferase [Parapedobacter koreensis]
MKVAIYCTGGTNLGFGHFFRSKTFAKSAPDGFSVWLFPLVAAEDKHIFNELADITRVCESEDHALNQILDYAPDIVVFDTVYCSDRFFFEIKSKVRNLMSISPVFNQMLRVDLLFTRNEDTLPIGNVKIFKGFEFAIFNENCKPISDELYINNLNNDYLTIGIAMGGGDAPNKTLAVLKHLSYLKTPCTFWVLLGEGYRHSYQDLVDCITKDSNHEIILAKTNRSVWSILANCSLAILAGGLTTLESVYAGLPTINIFDREEQIYATGKRIFDTGISINLGVFKELKSIDLINKINHLYDNKSLLLEMRNKGKGLVDKKGSKRVFQILASNLINR